MNERQLSSAFSVKLTARIVQRGRHSARWPERLGSPGLPLRWITFSREFSDTLGTQRLYDAP